MAQVLHPGLAANCRLPAVHQGSRQRESWQRLS